MTYNDENQVNKIIDLSFPMIYRFIAAQSTHEEGQVLVSETAGRVVGFAKLVDFHLGGKKYSCILWIAVHPAHRRQAIAINLTNASINFLKKDDSHAIFASAHRRNKAALGTLSRAGFERIGFLELWRLFGWRVFEFYRDIWFAPGEVVLMQL